MTPEHSPEELAAQLERESTCPDCVGVDVLIPPDTWSNVEDRRMTYAARHIASGIEHGSWCCDHVDWNWQDAADAALCVAGRRSRERDRARAQVERLTAENTRLQKALERSVRSTLAQVRGLSDATQARLNDAGPWGSGYRRAAEDLTTQIALRWPALSAPEEAPE